MAKQKRQTCKWGHPWTKDNIREYGYSRYCIQCQKDRQARRIRKREIKCESVERPDVYKYFGVSVRKMSWQ